MAGQRKAEGIALLSLYNDEDMDVDEDVEDQEDEEDQGVNGQQVEKLPVLPVFSPSAPVSSHSTSPEAVLFSTIETALPIGIPEETELSTQGIVDYAHDEAALSPEAEEGEILSTGPSVNDQDIDASNGLLRERSSPDTAQELMLGMVSTIQSEEPGDQLKDKSDNRLVDSGAGLGVATSLDIEMNSSKNLNKVTSEEDPLADFLPPPPTAKCSEELQNKFSKYLALKNAGRSFNEELRKSKGYRNPDFLQRAVKYQEIDQIGSCFRKEIFDPHGYDPSDFYDALALELRREMERKEQEKKRNQRVDFVHGGVQSLPSTVLPDNRPKPTIPLPGGQKGVGAVSSATLNTATGVHMTTTGSEAPGKGDGRSSKKSKWDKVDNDGRAAVIMPAGAKDAIAAASAQAALLSANAGAGYASFVQQKRKEAEERSKAGDKGTFKSDRKADRS